MDWITRPFPHDQQYRTQDKGHVKEWRYEEPAATCNLSYLYRFWVYTCVHQIYVYNNNNNKITRLFFFYLVFYFQSKSFPISISLLYTRRIYHHHNFERNTQQQGKKEEDDDRFSYKEDNVWLRNKWENRGECGQHLRGVYIHQPFIRK